MTTAENEADPAATQFDYSLITCADYDAVLSGEGEQVSPADLVSRAFDTGRVLIQAKGGSGKTTFLALLAAAASDSDARVSRLDAMLWADSQADTQRDPRARRRLLNLSTPPVSEADLRKATRTLILIDGLNEVSPQLGASMLSEVDFLASQFPSLAIILTDRLHRRRLAEKLWVLATLSPVSQELVQKLLGGVVQDSESETTLRLPYYLNLALHGDRGSRSDQHRNYLLAHGGVAKDTISELAAAAYSQYKANSDRSVNLSALKVSIGTQAVDALISAGTLVVEPTCRFTHHLVHDYLSATYVATRPELWDSEGLDVLTFKATSMDALAMVLEQAPEDADLLVRRVYDWNFYGAASLIAEDRRSGSHVSPAMELAVVTMLGERRFDPFASTARQVSDSLRVIDTQLAGVMSRSTSRQEIIEFVRENGASIGQEKWLDEWIELYTRSPSQPSTVRDVEILATEDSVLGWTMSNVLRRTRMDREVVERVAYLGRIAPSSAVRWRAVHALGADPTVGTVDALFKSLDEDASVWVRYGAVRSVIEIAIRAKDLRELILARLAERATLLRSRPQLTKEIERVLLPRTAPDGWADSTAPLVETLWAQSKSIDEQDRWRELGTSIRSLATEAP